MSTIITRCDKCNSDDIKDLTPEVREISRKGITNMKAECQNPECKHIFEYPTWTRWGKRSGILY